LTTQSKPHLERTKLLMTSDCSDEGSIDGQLEGQGNTDGQSEGSGEGITDSIALDDDSDEGS